jgi:hypothetical protein
MTATETARKAIETARNLSPAMCETMRLSHGRGVTPACGRVATIAALVSRGLVVGTTAYEQPMTDLGRVVHAVLVDGEAAVLADAERQDKDAKAAAHAQRAYDAMEAAAGMANANHAIERGSSKRWMGEALDKITDRTDARAVAYRVTLLDELHGRALAEDAEWTAERAALAEQKGYDRGAKHAKGPDTVSLGRSVAQIDQEDAAIYPALRGARRAYLDELHGRAFEEVRVWAIAKHDAAEGRRVAAEYLARDFTERQMGERLDSYFDDGHPMVHAFRAAVIDELHARALADHTAWENAYASEIAEVERHGASTTHLREQRDRYRAGADTPPVPAEVDTAEPVAEALPIGGLTEQSLALFLAYAQDASNWSGTPPVDGNVAGTAEGRGNLTQMKRLGLITTFRYDSAAWVDFTPEGRALAAAHNIVIP